MQKAGFDSLKKCYKDDLLDEIYLSKKHIGEMTYLFKTEDSEYYSINKDILMCVPINKEDPSFRIINYEFKDAPSDPSSEIIVSPLDAEISFITSIKDKKDIRFKASFDHYSKEWDVRSNIETFNKPSNLNESLLELNKLKEGVIEFRLFTRMIDTISNLFQNSINNKPKTKLKTL